MTTHIRFFDYEGAFDYYCGIIDKMRQGNNSILNSRIIAKPVFILSIIRLIDEGLSVNKFSYEEIEGTYNNIFHQYLLKAHQLKVTPLCYPYYYLKSDKFWHLVWTLAETKTEAPSAAWIKRNVKYACIDKELWILLSHEPYRQKMKQYIIEEKILKAFKGESKGMFRTLLQLLMVV